MPVAPFRVRAEKISFWAGCCDYPVTLLNQHPNTTSLTRALTVILSEISGLESDPIDQLKAKRLFADFGS